MGRRHVLGQSRGSAAVSWQGQPRTSSRVCSAWFRFLAQCLRILDPQVRLWDRGYTRWPSRLACRRSAGRHQRHALAKDVIVRSIRSVDVHATLELSRLLRGDGKRPDGATLDPLKCGQYLVWDFTCPDTLAPFYLDQSSLATGSAASLAKSRKRSKFAELSSLGNYIFVPIAIETLGAWGPCTLEICAELGGEDRKTHGRSSSDRIPQATVGHCDPAGQCGCSGGHAG
jgi:hypothetical protein